VTGPPYVEVIGLSKRFGDLQALNEVDLQVKPGQFHALIGENGAGKSTLAKCIMGVNRIDGGEIRVNGKPNAAGSPREARASGIGMVFQHFTLIPSMTVAENLVLARPDLPLVIRWRAEMERLKKFIEHAPFPIDLHTPVSQLAAGQKQKVEILKELYLETRFLMLDEPTSVLTPDEADEVLGLLRTFVSAGRLSVLMITHKFREVIGFADEVTVLRRGKLVGSRPVSQTSPPELAAMMMGTTAPSTATAKVERVPGKAVFTIDKLCVDSDNGLSVLHDLGLTVHAGEILGIAGVSGNGQKELVEAISGQRRIESGEMRVSGEPYTPTRDAIRRFGFHTLPEEPLRNAAIASMTVAENMVLRDFDRPPFAGPGGLLNFSAIERNSVGLIERFSVSPPSPHAPIGSLSGGNVQRAILAREFGGSEIKVLVAANPCFGLDFKAVAFIHNHLVEVRNRGGAVLLISEDLDELLELADRIVVMSEGSFVYENVSERADRVSIGRHMAGHHAE
jgi:ABC-type uncharacterized transport system ATPase subunit